MERVWFIQINGNKEGPYSISELKRDRRITPNTLVWRKGFPEWVPIRFVKELKVVFEDEPAPVKTEEDRDKMRQVAKGKNEIALDLRKDFPPYVVWLLLALLLSYLAYKIYFK